MINEWIYKNTNRVHSGSGVIVETKGTGFILKLDLSNLVAGSYSLKIEDGTGKNYMKQIVLTK